LENYGNYIGGRWKQFEDPILLFTTEKSILFNNGDNNEKINVNELFVRHVKQKLRTFDENT